MNYTVYDPITGQIQYTFYGQGDNLINNLNDKTYIEGAYNDRNHYVDPTTKTVVDKPAKPSRDHQWDHATKTWQLDNAKAIDSARQQRNQLLSAVDRVNPIWFSGLTTDQKLELSVYRTSLLNVPQQAGFPISIEWPTKPTWL